MYRKLILGAAVALLTAGLGLSSPSYAQDQKAPAVSPPTGQGMMMMPPDMMARMSKMMEQCEKMMGSGDMHKGMQRHKSR